MTETYVAVYRRHLIGPDRLVHACGDRDVVERVAQMLLARLPLADDDPLADALLCGRRRALSLLAVLPECAGEGADRPDCSPMDTHVPQGEEDS